MIPMLMALAQAGTAVAGTGLSIFGNMQSSAMRRQARIRVEQLQNNAAIVGQRTGFEQGRIQDQVDAAVGRQANHWAAGNIDPLSASPAILAAQSEAIGMQDQLLVAAKGQQERADIYGQIAATWGKADDASTASILNSASAVLGMAGKLAGIAGGQAGQAGGWGNIMTPAATFPVSTQLPPPMDIRPRLGDIY